MTSTFDGTNQMEFDLVFPIDTLPSGSVVTGATLGMFHTTTLDGPGGNTGCAPPVGFVDGSATTRWGSVHWCTNLGFAEFLNDFSISDQLEGGSTFVSATGSNSGTYDYFFIAPLPARAALLDHSIPLNLRLSVSTSSTFIGYTLSPFAPPPGSPPPASYTNSAIGHADLTLDVTYSPAGPVSSVPEPSTYAALIGLALVGMAWKRRASVA